MMTHAIVWIGTDSHFNVRSFETAEECAEYADIISDSGLPMMFITRDNVIYGGIDDE